MPEAKPHTYLLVTPKGTAIDKCHCVYDEAAKRNAALRSGGSKALWMRAYYLLPNSFAKTVAGAMGKTVLFKN